MKKYLLMIVVFQFLSLDVWAFNYEVLFEGQSTGGTHWENQIPVTGNVNDDYLNINFEKANDVSVSVKDKYGSVVYQSQVNSTAPKSVGIDLQNYREGEYSINLIDSNGNTAVANFQVKK